MLARNVGIRNREQPERKSCIVWDAAFWTFFMTCDDVFDVSIEGCVQYDAHVKNAVQRYRALSSSFR